MKIQIMFYMPLFEKKDNIVNAREKYICISLCTTEKEVKPKKEPNVIELLNVFPYANAYTAYKKSGKKYKLGNICTFGNGKDQRYVTVLFTQYYSGHNNLPNDNMEKRLDWFKSALSQLSNQPNLDSVAFDYGNLTVDNGYDYKNTKQMLEDFALTYELHTGNSLTIILYINPRLPDPNKKKMPISTLMLRRTPNKSSGPPTKKEDVLDLRNIKFPEVVLNLDDFCKYEIVQDLDKRASLLELPIDPSWNWLFSDSVTRTKLDKINSDIGSVIYEDDTFPVADEIFNAFNYCNFDDLSVVILGQDPYPTRGNAHGLSFSVNRGVRIPASLKNIYLALENDGDVEFTMPDHGNLEAWAKQGVFLLNASLTVKEGQANCHQKIWTPFTDYVIRLISEKKKHLVFILWGGEAKKKKKLIDTSKHSILEFNHPSPMVRGNTFKTDCKNFSQANQKLREYGKPEIDWRL